jgi:hypothetical protein
VTDVTVVKGAIGAATEEVPADEVLVGAMSADEVPT